MIYAIVGDVHGEFAKLYQAIGIAVNKYPELTFVFLGDYVDRGAEPLETLKLVNHFRKEKGATTLFGNHDWRYKKNWDKGKDIYPKQLPEEQQADFKTEMYDLFEHGLWYFKNDEFAASHAPVAVWQHDWKTIGKQTFVYGWTKGMDDTTKLPKRIMIEEKFPGVVSEKPVFFGHLHAKRLYFGNQQFCLDYDAGEPDGQVSIGIFTEGYFIDHILV